MKLEVGASAKSLKNEELLPSSQQSAHSSEVENKEIVKQEYYGVKKIWAFPWTTYVIQLLYVIESAAYRVTFMSYLCQNANEWGTSEWKLLTQTSEYNPIQSTFYDVSCLSHILREFSLKQFSLSNTKGYYSEEITNTEIQMQI